MNKNLLIIIPAYNEALTIGNVVINCKKYGDVLVINDGSNDRTEVCAKQAGAEVLTNEKNLGYENSLNVGYLYAINHQYTIMLTMDADGQLPEAQIPIFVDQVLQGSALAVGKRKKLSRFTEISLSIFSKIMSRIEDPYCGMKAYDLTINPKNTFSTYNSVGTSLALSYAALNLPISNLEIDINPRDGQSKFGGRIVSEIKLMPSFVIGIIRLFIIFFSRLAYRISKYLKNLLLKLSIKFKKNL